MDIYASMLPAAAAVLNFAYGFSMVSSELIRP